MDFKEYLDKATWELEGQVEKILKQWLKEVEGIDKKLVPLAKAFIKSCKGGKRIRGTLVKLGYEIAQAHLPGVRAHLEGGAHLGGVTHLKGGIPKIGAAYEIFHSAILAHDDIIDQSSVRRGHPSLYQALGGRHYGISQTISLGDFGFFLSFKIISESSFPDNLKTAALRLFSKLMMDTALGEMLDLEKADPLTVMKFKTAQYTIKGPLQLGAILGRAGENLIKELGEFGENLGVAFQIKDDILDSDIIEEKGIDYAKKEAKRYKNQAMKLLPSITKDKKMSKLLEQMTQYLIERKR